MYVKGLWLSAHQEYRSGVHALPVKDVCHVCADQTRMQYRFQGPRL